MSQSEFEADQKTPSAVLYQDEVYRLQANVMIESDQTDRIELSSIRCYGYTGFLPEEQVLGQWFEVDLVIQLDLATAGASDQIADTLDYRQVISTTQQLVKTARFALVERLATTIADAILALDKVQAVQVRLHKPAAPIPDFGGRITIDITRRQS